MIKFLKELFNVDDITQPRGNKRRLDVFLDENCPELSSKFRFIDNDDVRQELNRVTGLMEASSDVMEESCGRYLKWFQEHPDDLPA